MIAKPLCYAARMSSSAAATLPPSPRAETLPANECPRPTSAHQTQACAALAAGHEQAPQAVERYLDALASCFDEFALREPTNGLLDSKVLASIDQFAPYLGEYRRFVAALAQQEVARTHAPALIGFLTRISAYKRVDRDQFTQSNLWADGYRFILRELFLTSVAILLRHGRYAFVGDLLRARYPTVGRERLDDSFVIFDGYAKTLDEFRNRRLQLHRLSVSSDLLRDRADAAYCDFDEIMQADFLLCLRSLLCEDNFFVRWFPRTLVFAERYAVSGFDLFVTTVAPERFSPLAALLGFADRDALLRRFDDVRDAWCLDSWELGGCPLDFQGFMGLRNAALVV